MTIPPRPTIYRGIQMRSRLEAHFAQWLDSLKLKWEYEPVCFASEEGQYLPDFRLPAVHVGGTGERTVYFECKPPLDKAGINAVFTRMRVIWASEPNAMLALAMDDDDAPWFWLEWRAGDGLDFPRDDTQWGDTADAIWVRCGHCGLARIDSERHLHRSMFFPEPPMVCPQCAKPGVDWISQRKPHRGAGGR